jgi:SAM-dependent methyltransferase/spore coat polysaccharide biosynthesis predicted glycosyltransferase SpsG
MLRSILLVPSVSKGNGSGHLMRCFALAKALGPGAVVYVPEAKAETSWSAAELALAFSRELDGISLVTSLRDSERDTEPARSWDLVVLDRRSVSRDELAFWELFGPVLALDEGGEARDSAHYTIDILPRVSFASRGAELGPNKASLGFLNLPKKRRDPPQVLHRALVSFGGEDPAGLSLTLARLLVAEGLVQAADLTLVSGALRRGAPPLGLDGVTVLGPVQDLKEHLHRFDLVFTQFGLTAFEAAWAGCGVILLNPSSYHQMLSREAGFADIGVRKPDLLQLRRWFSSPAELLARTTALLPEEPESLADFISCIAPSGPRTCPACSSFDRLALYRDESRSLFRCGDCGLVYLSRFSAGREDPYHEAYFFEEYRRQYGLTYLEDWPKLVALASSRLDAIEAIASRSLGHGEGLSVLDVGCAFGPFLAAARDRGHDPRGLDASKEAVAYVRSELGIPAASGDFLDPATASVFGGPFDVVTMWYVIEHFEDLDRALRSAAALVRPGGLLAFSTPSGEGASARFDREAFYRRSPDDHFSIWEPSRVKALLESYGFAVVRVRITGHHPERIPFFRHWASASCPAPLRAIGRGLGHAISKIFSLGDTFEVYALRETAELLVEDERGETGSRPVRVRRGGISRS